MLTVEGLYTEYPNERGEVVKAAQDVSFTVDEGRLFTLLGPSGCGKTTTLRSIAGLERPRSGQIAVNGRVVYSSAKNIFVAPNRRGFGMVFQSYAIWPHMTVFENAAFPLEVGRNKCSRKDVRDRVMRVLTAVQLDHLADREATKLSGGQQQRLALARALVMEPALLLLDEPLSNLDAKLREKMRFELKRLQRELKITTVYVTHDQSEALALSHEIAVMNEGRIQQIGTPREIYERPGSQFVADFVGNTNFIEGVVTSRLKPASTTDTAIRPPLVSTTDVGAGTPTDTGTRTRTEMETRTPTDMETRTATGVGAVAPTDTEASTPTGVGAGFSRLIIRTTRTPTDMGTGTPTDMGTGTPTGVGVVAPTDTDAGTPTGVGAGFSRLIIRTELGDVNVDSSNQLGAGEKVAISIRPEDVDLMETRPSSDNVWEGRVEQKVFLGEAVDFQVKVGPRTLLSRQHPTLRTKVGESIFVRLDPDKCVVLKIS